MTSNEQRKNIDPSRLFFGCGNFGGVGSSPELVGQGDDERRAHELLDEACALDILQFDTANTYGNGLSEEYLGRWIKKQDSALRSRIMVSTKVGNSNGTREGRTPLCREEISFHLDRSLTRLGVERVEIYYTHAPDPVTPLEETAEAMCSALKAGKISFVGLSNVDASYVNKFLGACDSGLRGKVRFVQNEFHYLKTSDREELFPVLKQNGMNYVAFSPLAGGILTGKYKPGSPPPAGSRVQLRPEPYQEFMNEKTFAVISGFIEDAKSRGITPAQNALRFVLEEPGVYGAVIGPRSSAHFAALGLKRRE